MTGDLRNSRRCCQFGIKSLLLLMLLVGCFLAGRMSLHSELQSVKRRLRIEAERANAEQRIQVAAEAERAYAEQRIQVAARREVFEARRAEFEVKRRAAIDAGMKADELERRGLLPGGRIDGAIPTWNEPPFRVQFRRRTD